MRNPVILILALYSFAGCAPPPDWAGSTSLGAMRFQAIDVVDASTIWVSGTLGSWARSTDGGLSWTSGSVPEADSLEFRDVAGMSADHAFLMSAGSGPASRIYRTQDGGASWQEVFRNVEPDGFFDCLDFWDDRRGIVFSDAIDTDFLLLITEDGGDSWRRVPPEALPDARTGEGAFAASGTCLLAGADGRAWFGTGASGIDTRVYRTTDFGVTWEAHRSPIPSASGSSGIFTLVQKEGRLAAALGGEYVRPDSAFGHVAVTADDGRTWRLAGDSGLGGAVYGAALLPEGGGMIAVNPTGIAYSADGADSWIRMDSLDHWAVAGLSSSRAIAVGPEGRISRLMLP